MIGEDGPVGSGVGEGVGVAETVGEGAVSGVEDADGVAAGFVTTFFCQINFLATFLQIKFPEVAFTFVHVDPSFGEAACEIAGIESKPATIRSATNLDFMGTLSQMLIDKVKMSDFYFKVWV